MYANEEAVGKGISESGVKREEIFLTTKISTTVMRESEAVIRASIDESLRKLQTSYIDLLLIHWSVKDCVKKTWQIVLRWIVQRDLITIPRAKPNHFAENLEILQFVLAEEDMAQLNTLNINLRSNKDNDPETFPW